MTETEEKVLVELEKVLQTCNQMYLAFMTRFANYRNKILVKAVDTTKQAQSSAGKAADGMDIWKRLVDQHVEVSDDQMEIDE
jgi:hypothetical protein